MPNRYLAAALAVIAGMVDLMSFMNLDGIFTAHVTGNLVILTALAIEGRHAKLGQTLAVPVFIVTAAVVWLLVRRIGALSPAATRAVLLMQFGLLLAVLLVSVLGHVTQSPTGSVALVTVLLATSAMAAQNALLHLQVPGSPATAVMTGNLVSTIIFALDAVSNEGARHTAAAAHLRNVLGLLGGFMLGCAVAAAFLLIDRDWAWALPATSAGLVLLWKHKAPTLTVLGGDGRLTEHYASDPAASEWPQQAGEHEMGRKYR